MKTLSLMFILLVVTSPVSAQLSTEQLPKATDKPASPDSSTQTGQAPNEGWRYDPDAGFVFQKGDFKWLIWGFAERLFDPNGKDIWRRVRQGMEFDLPRFNKKYRSAFVYEVDFTDTNFFRSRPRWKIFENLYYTIQDAEDASKFRFVFGENTHILAYEDNLSSGNLPTINRSLILEEHGSINSFGTQFGVQVQKALTSRYSIAFSAQDNRGSLNQPKSRYVVGNSLAAKLTAVAINDQPAGRRLTLGAGVDHTRDIRNRRFTLASALSQESLGGTEARGNKLTLEGFVVYTAKIKGHPYMLESEELYSNFSHSQTNACGGYAQAQLSLFGSERTGDLDPFIRYDFVHLSRGTINGAAFQRALRAGVNYNLPLTHKTVNFHIEYARNRIRGPIEIVAVGRSFNEIRFALRANVIRYLRH